MGEKKQIGSLIDVDLYRQAKALASMQGKRAGDVIEDALRAYLKRYSKAFGQAKKGKAH